MPFVVRQILARNRAPEVLASAAQAHDVQARLPHRARGFHPGGTGYPRPAPGVGAVATGPARAGWTPQRLPGDAPSPLRDRGHRRPDGAVQLVGAGCGVPRKELLPGPVDRLGRRLVPLYRAARLLVRPERLV